MDLEELPVQLGRSLLPVVLFGVLVVVLDPLGAIWIGIAGGFAYFVYHLVRADRPSITAIPERELQRAERLLATPPAIFVLGFMGLMLLDDRFGISVLLDPTDVVNVLWMGFYWLLWCAIAALPVLLLGLSASIRYFDPERSVDRVEAALVAGYLCGFLLAIVAFHPVVYSGLLAGYAALVAGYLSIILLTKVALGVGRRPV